MILELFDVVFLIKMNGCDREEILKISTLLLFLSRFIKNNGNADNIFCTLKLNDLKHAHLRYQALNDAIPNYIIP